jgi:dihydrofolate reductase
MTAIVAVDENWGIGKDGQLLVNLRSDLAHFKRMTMGGTIIMGRATAESFPSCKPLPGRRNIVLSRTIGYIDGFDVVSSREDALATAFSGMNHENVTNDGESLSDSPSNVFIIGGEQIYKLFLDDCTECVVTKMDATFDADSYFPNLDILDNWSIVEESEIVQDTVNYRIVRYKKCENHE